ASTSWYHSDHLGSIRLLTDNSGNVLDRVAYDAFGQITSEQSPANGDDYKYAGMQFDPSTGSYGDSTREYLPPDGRFGSQDSDGFDGGDVNLYRYVGNDPTNATDPTGQYILAKDEATAKEAEHILGTTLSLRDVSKHRLGSGRWYLHV